MEQQHSQQQAVDMERSSRELASQALAATGSKSTLKATEWILSNRRASQAEITKANNINKAGRVGGGGSQSKLDLFFQSGNNSSTNIASNSLPLQLRFAPEVDLASCSAGGDGVGDLDDCESNSSGSREDDECKKSPSGSGEAAIPTPTRGAVTGIGGGGGAGPGVGGGYDDLSGAPLGLRAVKSARGEVEEVVSLGHRQVEGEGIPRFYLAIGSSSMKDEEALALGGGDGGSFTNVKRPLLGQGASHGVRGGGGADAGGGGGGGGGGSGSAPKRQKHHGNEPYGTPSVPAPVPVPAPSPVLAPIFSGPHSFRLQSKQKVGNVQEKPARKSLAPLAERMRPATIDDVVGQDAPRHMLRNLLDNDTVPSIILFGPPGTGKTSIARAIARSLPGSRFVGLSAVHSGTKEVRAVLEEASKQWKRHGQRTLLFLDEVHRFNKTQQDLFLPSVEAGSIVFIGATTENPSFEINAALISRCRVLTLYKLEPEHVRKVLERAVADREKGVFASLPECVFTAEDYSIRVEEEALNFLAGVADGDARVALNAIEVATTAAYAEAKLTRTQNQEVAGTVPSLRAGGLVRLGSGNSTTGPGKKDPLGPSMFSGTDRAGNNAFGSKRLEALMENAMDCSQSNEDYTKPFKRFMGGKEITPLHNPGRFEREREREVVSISGGDVGRDPVSLRGVESAELVERKSGNPDAIVPEGADLDEGGGPGFMVTVTLLQVREAFQRSHVLYDKTGEEHYNIISALHKSMRGGNADAAIYWLARMLEGGEGPLYVARRLIRFASEDVGLADPHAMGIAVACYQACHFLGMPECNVNLAQCVVYLAYAPKSVVVYQAIEAAQKLVRETHHQNEPVPLHLRNAPTRLMKEMDYGRGYIYPPGHAGRVEQTYLPPALQGHKFLQWPQMND